MNSEEQITSTGSADAVASADSAATTTVKKTVRRSRRVSAAQGEAVAAPTAAGSPEASIQTETHSQADAPAQKRAPSQSKAAAQAKATTQAIEPVQQATVSEGGTAAPDASATGTTAAAANATEVKVTRAPRTRSTRATKVTKAQTTTEVAADASATAKSDAVDARNEVAVEPEAAPKKRQTRARKSAKSVPAEATVSAGAAAPAEAEASLPAAASAPADVDPTVSEPGTAQVADELSPVSAEKAEDAPAAAPRKRNSRSRNKKVATEAQTAEVGEQATPKSQQAAAESDETAAEKSEQTDRQEQQAARAEAVRSNRTRQRERKRRGQNDDLEPELSEDDVLLPIAGILDVLDNYAFVRTTGYLPGTNDVYVSLGQVKKYGLRKGDAIVGAIRQPRDGEGGGRQKYNAIVRIDSINSKLTEDTQTRPEFASLTPVFPNERLRLETTADMLTERFVDLFAPIGKGQRGLIIGAHNTGKSAALQGIAQAVAVNQPDVHLMMVLIDERPEEVTELGRKINGEVIASTFDQLAEDHVTVAELAIERAKRLVELGHDVVVLIDSLTALARAYNVAAPASARVPAGSLDATSTFPVKKLLSAARNIENGGSLTIVGAVSAQPGSAIDMALLTEIEGAANMQLVLSTAAADRRVFPAIDVLNSYTRHADVLTSVAEDRVLSGLRRAISGDLVAETLPGLIAQIAQTSSNVEYLAVAQREQSAS